MSDVRWHIVAVQKGDRSKPSDFRKAIDMTTVFSFVSKMNGYPMYDGESLLMILVPNRTGEDAPWFMDNVFRFADIQRSMNDAEAVRMADRLVNLAKEKDPEGEKYAGAYLIMMYARQMYMHFEEWEPDALRFEVKL